VPTDTVRALLRKKIDAATAPATPRAATTATLASAIAGMTMTKRIDVDLVVNNQGAPPHTPCAPSFPRRRMVVAELEVPSVLRAAPLVATRAAAATSLRGG
jgi:hypothetical protein